MRGRREERGRGERNREEDRRRAEDRGGDKWREGRREDERGEDGFVRAWGRVNCVLLLEKLFGEVVALILVYTLFITGRIWSRTVGFLIGFFKVGVTLVPGICKVAQ